MPAPISVLSTFAGENLKDESLLLEEVCKNYYLLSDYLLDAILESLFYETFKNILF